MTFPVALCVLLIFLTGIATALLIVKIFVNFCLSSSDFRKNFLKREVLTWSDEVREVLAENGLVLTTVSRKPFSPEMNFTTDIFKE